MAVNIPLLPVVKLSSDEVTAVRALLANTAGGTNYLDVAGIRLVWGSTGAMSVTSGQSSYTATLPAPMKDGNYSVFLTVNGTGACAADPFFDSRTTTAIRIWGQANPQPFYVHYLCIGSKP